MGQQQLLLLVLGIVIVGLAVVVGIQAFGENQKKANSDALVNDGVRIASDAQAWKLKPAAFGGGAGGANWQTDAATPVSLSFEQLGYKLGGNDCAATEYGNINGCFTMSGQTSANLVIVGKSHAAQALDNIVTVTVSGTTPESITTAVTTGS